VQDAHDASHDLLELQRERAERRLNGVRAGVLLLLGAAALIYAPTLTPALNRANILVLLPALAWTAAQYILLYRRARLPGWLPVVNPLVDIAAVTAILVGYGLAHSAQLAFNSPIFLAYFAIIAARPITSSTRKALIVSGSAVAAYAAFVTFFVATGRVEMVADPVMAISRGAISPLDEGARLLLLAVAGAIATYATAWHERMARSYHLETSTRAQLEARLARAELETLKLQVQPHFLFNTLNSITTLIPDEPVAAERMVTGLSELLRLSLRNSGAQEIPLARELELLEHYTSIQRIRFADRLQVDIDADPAALEALVPSLSLQPLVENAIRHGIAPRASGGHVRVTVRREGTRVAAEVVDNGVGSEAGAVLAGGTGLGNTRARLRHIHGADHTFSAGPEEGGGFAVRFEIPFRTAEREDQRVRAGQRDPAEPA
jgi:hypothetical protein